MMNEHVQTTSRCVPEINALADLGNPAEIEPALQGKVHTLSAVESKVKPCMVTSGVRDNKFPSMLDKCVCAHRRLLQDFRRSEVGFVAQELGTV